MRAIVAAAILVVATPSCAPLLVGLGLGLERGQADVVVRTDRVGTVFLERRPALPRATVVLLHGFGGSKDHWTRFIAELPDDLWIIAPDLWGFGESARVDTESFDLHTQSVRLQRFLVERGVRRYHMMGNSLGGQLAATHALSHSDDVVSLVLFDPAGIKGPVPSPMDELTSGGAEPMPIRTAADFDRLLSLSFVVQPRIPDALKGYLAEEAAKAYPFAQKVKADLWARPAPMIDAAGRLQPPTLVVWGACDQVLDPSAAPIWRARVAGGLVVMMKATGHAPMLERPAESAQLVLTWWSRALR
jgi:pimeloyl-ACP methyl ester carboxylesterase